MRKVDPLSLLGLVVGFAAILLGQYLEGGHVAALLNGPAMLIVFGGTVGAVMVQSPLPVFVRAVRMAVWVVVPPLHPATQAVQRVLRWSHLARKEGLLGLEDLADSETDSYAKKGLQLLVDGNEPETIRSTLEVELNVREQKDLQAARVFEGMGGYCPTIGILGAVMGLIHVMNNLADPSQLGSGIAVAFVATIYGVGLANLVFLPAANKLKNLISHQAQFRELLIEGFVAIAEGENPRNIETRLLGYLA